MENNWSRKSECNFLVRVYSVKGKDGLRYNLEIFIYKICTEE